jgi:hypothetical protein
MMPIRPSWAPAALLAAGLLAGCAGDEASRQQATAAQTALVGIPESTLLSCAGVPERSAIADGTRFLTYVARGGGGGGPSTSFGLGTGSGGTGVGIGLGFPLLGASGPRICEATFTVRDGVVQQLRYGIDADPYQCQKIVQNCLSR